MISSADSHKLLSNTDLPNRVSESFQKTKDLLTETASQAINTITEVRRAVPATTGSETSSLTETTGQATSGVNAVTSQAVDPVSPTAKQASNSLAEVIRRTSNSLEGTIQKAENAATKSVQGAMNSLIDEWIDSVKVWIDSHPIVQWLVQVILWAVNHPIPALIIAIALIFVLQKLLKVLGSLVERALIALLQAPLKLGQLLLKTSAKSLSKLGRAVQPVANQEETLELKALTESVKNSQKERLANILTRLEVIRQEQDQLIQEVAAIVALDEPDRDINRPVQSDQRFQVRLFQNQSKDEMQHIPRDVQ